MKSEGERLMARYLTGRGWPCEYERPVGDRKLDFYVHHPEVGPFAAEAGSGGKWLRPRRRSSRTWRPRLIETGDKSWRKFQALPCRTTR